MEWGVAGRGLGEVQITVLQNKKATVISHKAQFIIIYLSRTFEC